MSEQEQKQNRIFLNKKESAKALWGKEDYKQGKEKFTKVILEIDFCESDEILLGELDYYLTKHFKIKKIQVGKENINYK